MEILGTGTRRQKDIVRKVLQKVGPDANTIRRIEVYNTKCVKKYSFTSESHEIIVGFAVLPNLKCHIVGNRIVLAGKDDLLEYTTLHELGHLINGHIESQADEYAFGILNSWYGNNCISKRI